jgi:tetratricopeptide (TPR) repeat protein
MANDLDDTMHRIKAAIDLRFSGNQETARRCLTEIWEEISQAGNPIQLCAVAHHLADLQNDLNSELAWDLRALQAADSVTDAHRAALPSIPADTFYPSLHVNLGEDYRKLGNLGKAHEHLARAREALAQCGEMAGMGPDDAYGKLVRSGLERLVGLLDGTIQED